MCQILVVHENDDVITVCHAHEFKWPGKATNPRQEYQQWCDFFRQEQCELSLDVCDYQGAILVYNPDGS